MSEIRLIDAEALKKALKDAHINMKLTFDIATFNCVMNTIDNAPTVKTYETFSYEKGFQDGAYSAEIEKLLGKQAERALSIIDRLYTEGHINNMEQGVLRRAILLPEEGGAT